MDCFIRRVHLRQYASSTPTAIPWARCGIPPCAAPRWNRYYDRWEGLLITFVALARGESQLGLPALGGIFDHGVIPDLESVRLSNRSLMDAIYRLAWLKDSASLIPVNWRDMETEELGSVYESLLELTPRLVDEGRGFAFAEGAETKGQRA